jgi:hypothetical protein
MTKAARYTVLIDRELGQSDGRALGYHDGFGRHAVEQLTRELQEAWNESGSVSGFFEVVERCIIDWPDGVDNKLFAGVARHYEDEHEGDPTPADYAGRIRFLGALLADIKDEFGTGEVAISLDNALDDIDSAIRTLEGEDFCHECGQEFTIDDEGVANHVDPSKPDGIDHDADADHVPFALDEDESD